MLIGSTFGLTGAMPAQAAPSATLQVTKSVDDGKEVRDLKPGESVTYRVLFSVEDAAANSPVQLTDVLPEAFEGWAISGLNATVGGSTEGVTLTMPGVAGIEGVVGTGVDARTITVDVALELDSEDGTGMPTSGQGALDYTLTVPETLTPDWEFNTEELINTAVFTAKADDIDLREESSALITVDVPTTINVTPTKSWNPNEQGFQPGATSTVTIGGTQASNVPAQKLILQDPVTAENGANELDASNPFQYVDFAGFDVDPGSILPSGAESVDIEVYTFDGSAWNWVPYSASVADADVAGVRLTYTGENIEIGASVSQPFTVKQRANNRITDGPVSEGYTANNEMSAIVEVGEDSVTKQANASLTVTEETIGVEARKAFLDENGDPVSAHSTTAGSEVSVVLGAINNAAPLSTTLDSLIITEPGPGSAAEYFSADLSFIEFESIDWPAGATGATVRWAPSGDSTPTFTKDDDLPTAPAGITGFDITFAGEIEPGAEATVQYKLGTSENLAADGTSTSPFKNTIVVTGERDGLDPVTDTDDASLTVVAPKIEVNIDKQLSPSVVLPNQSVIVQLPTNVETSGGLTKPTEIIVEDKFSGENTFWDAFDAKEILPPINYPTDSTLIISYLNDSDEWVALAVDPISNTAIAVPEGAKGLRFEYTKDDGFGTTTYVKPNIRFESRDTLRSDSDVKTATQEFEPTEYENVATAKSTGKLGDRTVEGDDEATGTVGIRPTTPFEGEGGLWLDKKWNNEYLTSQSGATTSTTQRWIVAKPGYEQVTLQDPATVTTSGAGSVFEAFNLTAIEPITAAEDPLLQWDKVTAVELHDGTGWQTVTAPGAGWMNGSTFVGYELDSTQIANTVGVRLVVEENSTARETAIADGNIGAPEVGSGVVASAELREFTLNWQLRDQARGTASETKWVTSTETFNCEESAEGCIDNVFALIAKTGDEDTTRTAHDTILLIDDVGNVSLSKTADPLSLVAPEPGDLDQADYPTARYSLSAANASSVPEGSAGAIKLGKIRVIDPSSPDGTCATPSDFDDGEVFDDRTFIGEASNGCNHFDFFNLQGVEFEPLPGYIDVEQSKVTLWLYENDNQSREVFTIKQVQEKDIQFLDALPNAIGIAVTYQNTSPDANGGKIVVGDPLTVHLDVQLRSKKRADGSDVTAPEAGVNLPVRNQATALGHEPVVNPRDKPTAKDEATINLNNAAVDVQLAKRVRVENNLPDSSNTTVYEADPMAPVNVRLTATPGESTAPIDQLIIEDTTEEFWQRFEFVAFDDITLPTDADQALEQVRVGTEWITRSDYTGNLTDVDGVRVLFDREDAAKFPQDDTSWRTSWNKAVMNFTVQLREGATVEWTGEKIDNTAETTASHDSLGEKTADAEGTVNFAPGAHQIEVQKRAPNDKTTHIVSPLVSTPWQLVFTNTGTSYLPIEKVTDTLPADLRWDGDEIRYTASDGDGLTVDPDEISVTESPDGDSLVFVWPEGSRMEPGEKMTIHLGLVLRAGLTTGERATNEVVVSTGVPLNACVQPTTNGQVPSTDLAENECGNTNYVQPEQGTLIGTIKTVNGEFVPTLDESLVDGGMNFRTGEECREKNWSEDGFTREPCAAYTAVGATDRWRLEHVNVGTSNLEKMTVVDMLPTTGDRMLAGGGSRGSTFQPVLVDPEAIEFKGLPSGANHVTEVTTEANACVSDGTGSNWLQDPECNAGTWTDLSSYSGTAADIAGLRIKFDFAETALAPGETVTVEFETVNRVVEATEQSLKPELDNYADRQFAWNQNGVVAWDASGKRTLPKAPERAGVTVQTGELEISKDLTGAFEFAPDSVPVALSCTIPSGVDNERTELDMGVYSLIQVPGNVPGTSDEDRVSVTVSDIPIGADCVATEVAERETEPTLGEFGEVARSIETTPGVTPSEDGMTAELKIRNNAEQPDGSTDLRFANEYALGELVIEKMVESSNEHDLSAEQLAKQFEFELACDTFASGDTAQINQTLTFGAGEQARVDGLPIGATCELTETNTGEAGETFITVGEETTEGVTVTGVAVGETPTEVSVANFFEGPTPPTPGDPPGLSVTGGQIAWAALAATILLALGATVVLARRRNADGS